MRKHIFKSINRTKFPGYDKLITNNVNIKLIAERTFISPTTRIIKSFATEVALGTSALIGYLVYYGIKHNYDNVKIFEQGNDEDSKKKMGIYPKAIELSEKGDIDNIRNHLYKSKRDLYTIYLYSCKYGHLHVVDMLMTEFNFTLRSEGIYWAATGGKNDIIYFLIDKLDKIDPYDIDYAIFNALKNNHPKTVKLLLDYSLNHNDVHQEISSVLSWTRNAFEQAANKNNSVEMFRHFANTQNKIINGNAWDIVLFSALENKNYELFKLIVEDNLSKYSTDLGQIFYSACSGGDFKIMEYIIKNAKNKFSYQEGFEHACRRGRYDVVKYLYELDKTLDLDKGLEYANQIYSTYIEKEELVEIKKFILSKLG